MTLPFRQPTPSSVFWHGSPRSQVDGEAGEGLSRPEEGTATGLPTLQTVGPANGGCGGGSPSRSVLPHVPSPAGSVLPYSGREAPFFPEILSNSWPDGSWLSCLQCVSCPGPAGLRDARPPHSLSPEQALRPWRKWTRSAPQQSGPAPVRTALSADLGQESRQKTHRGVTSLGEPVRASVHHFTVCEDAFSPERYFHSLSCLPPSVLITNRMKNRQTPPNKAKPPPV